MGNHQFIDDFIRTGSQTLAVDIGLGAIFLAAAFATIWCGLNRGWGDDRAFWLTFLIVGPATLFLFPDLAIIAGMLVRGWFFGSLPAVGWLSFGALVLLAGVAIGIQWAMKYRAVEPQTIRAQPEPRPAVTAATSWPKPLPKAKPEPARLTRVETPPAVPLEYRREAMPVVRRPRR